MLINKAFSQPTLNVCKKEANLNNKKIYVKNFSCFAVTH